MGGRRLAAVVVAWTCALFLLPRDLTARTVSAWWGVFVLLVVLWLTQLAMALRRGTLHGVGATGPHQVSAPGWSTLE